MAGDIYNLLTLSHVPDDSDQAVIYYVAGACSRSVFRMNKCASCKEILVKEKEIVEIPTDETPEASLFLKSINRGGLLEPQDHTFQVCLLSWKIFFEI